MDFEPKYIHRWTVVLFAVIICVIIPDAIGGSVLEVPYPDWDPYAYEEPIGPEEEPKPYVGFPLAFNKRYWAGNGSCVPYARYKTGIDMYGWAGTFLDRAEENGYIISTVPKVGGLVITNESNGHVAVVSNVESGKLHISEQNFLGKFIVSNRILDLEDERILGYIY